VRSAIVALMADEESIQRQTPDLLEMESQRYFGQGVPCAHTNLWVREYFPVALRTTRGRFLALGDWPFLSFPQHT
jgi:hypothetical protein